MAWPAEMDLAHREKLKQACMGFATGVSAHSLSDIFESGALLSNKELEKRNPEKFGTAMRKSQWHDRPENVGYSCVYFRGVRRRKCSQMDEYLSRIVNSLASVGSTQGLVFYVDFDTAYEKLVYGFSNSTDMNGNGGKGSLNGQVDMFVDAFLKGTQSQNGQNMGLSEIAFKKQVPLSCVSFIGISAQKTQECPSYQNDLAENFTELRDNVTDYRGNEWIFFRNNGFREEELLRRSAYMALGSLPSVPSDTRQPSVPFSPMVGHSRSTHKKKKIIRPDLKKSAGKTRNALFRPGRKK